MNEQDKLEALQDLFLHKGWGIVKEDLENLRKVAVEGAHTECPTNDEWQFRRGTIQILDYVLGIEPYTKAQVEMEESEGAFDV